MSAVPGGASGASGEGGGVAAAGAATGSLGVLVACRTLPVDCCVHTPHRPCSSIKRQLKTALSERDSQTQKANELQAQLQDKKRQLFSAIQVHAARRPGPAPADRRPAVLARGGQQTMRDVGLVEQRRWEAGFAAKPRAGGPGSSQLAVGPPVTAGARGPAPASSPAGGQMPRVPGGAAVQDLPCGEGGPRWWCGATAERACVLCSGGSPAAERVR